MFKNNKIYPLNQSRKLELEGATELDGLICKN